MTEPAACLALRDGTLARLERKLDWLIGQAIPIPMAWPAHYGDVTTAHAAQVAAVLATLEQAPTLGAPKPETV